MKVSKRKKLEAAGWKVGTVSEFLELTPEEEALVEIKLALASEVKERRKKKRLTQVKLGKITGSSQSRIAKMEAADESVSVDMMLRSLISLGATPNDIGNVISGRSPKKNGGKKTSLAAN